MRDALRHRPTHRVRLPAAIAASALAPMILAATAPPQEAKDMQPAVPVVRLAELEIDPRHRDAYIALLREEIEASIRLEPGVLTLDAVALKDAPNRIRLMEIYADQAAYEAHLTSPHFVRYKTATASMVRSLTLRETIPIALGSRR